LVVSGDVKRATASFDRALQNHREQITPLVLSGS
jgi:hypothetical protein